jgi:cobalamin synthase
MAPFRTDGEKTAMIEIGDVAIVALIKFWTSIPVKSRRSDSKSISRPLHDVLPAMPTVGVYYGPEARLYSHRFKQ